MNCIQFLFFRLSLYRYTLPFKIYKEQMSFLAEVSRVSPSPLRTNCLFIEDRLQNRLYLYRHFSMLLEGFGLLLSFLHSFGPCNQCDCFLLLKNPVK